MIREDQIAQLLRAATDDIEVEAVPAHELAAAGSRRRRSRRVVAIVASSTAVAAAAVGIPLALNADSPSHGPAIVSPPPATCVDPVPSGVLPTWARAGFSDPKPRMPYVLGDNGDIVAIVWAQPLASPPSRDYNNKILWASRVGSGTLHITATLADGSTTANRRVEGAPGPSIINLPEPGCWHLALRWGSTTDSLNLQYDAPHVAGNHG
jgi:hypothetical protein